MIATAEQVGLAAIRWRRLDIAALELEARTSPTIFGCMLIPADYAGIDPALKAIDKQWKIAAKAASDAHDDFMALLDEVTPEQEIMGE